jgi:hypothetical protein
LEKETTVIQAEKKGQVGKRSWPAAGIVKKKKRLEHKQQ